MKNDFNEHLFKFMDHMRQRNLSQLTLDTRTNAINKLFNYLAQKHGISCVCDVSREMLEQYQTWLIGKELKICSVHSYLQSIKDFFRFITKERHILFNPAEAIILPRVVRGLPRNIPTIQDMEKILELPDLFNPMEFRDKAIMELMYSSGIRISEVTKIDIYDIDLDGGFLRVHGKGKRERVVPVGKVACQYIRIYVEKIRKKVTAKNPSEQALFVGMTTGRRLKNLVLHQHIKKYMRMAGLKNCSCHSIRHATATHMMQQGASIRLIQKMLGHRLLTTTQIYTNVVKKDLKKVHAETHPEASREIIRFQG